MAELEGDWIKLHRRVLDSDLFTDDWLTRLWVWCLCKANFRDATFRGQSIKRGQFVTGRITAADELGVSPSKWYRGIAKLCDLRCITTTSNSNWTTITVCRYEDYQNTPTKSEQVVIQRLNSQRTADDTTTEQPADTIEEEQESKKGRREEGKKVSAVAVSDKPVEPKETWLTPYCQAWEEFFGGEMIIGPACRPLKKLEGQHGPEEVTRRWRKYCEANQGEGQFASAAKFATTFGQWGGEHRNGKQPNLFRGLQQFVAEAEGRLP